MESLFFYLLMFLNVNKKFPLFFIWLSTDNGVFNRLRVFGLTSSTVLSVIHKCMIDDSIWGFFPDLELGVLLSIVYLVSWILSSVFSKGV